MPKPPDAGSQTLYRREMCDRFIQSMAKGLTTVALRIGISARPLFNRQKQHPEFLQAIREGRQRSQLWWKGTRPCLAHGKVGNTQIVMLGLRNRTCSARTSVLREVADE
jgi:hypothetical protein